MLQVLDGAKQVSTIGQPGPIILELRDDALPTSLLDFMRKTDAFIAGDFPAVLAMEYCLLEEYFTPDTLDVFVCADSNEKLRNLPGLDDGEDLITCSSKRIFRRKFGALKCHIHSYENGSDLKTLSADFTITATTIAFEGDDLIMRIPYPEDYIEHKLRIIEGRTATPDKIAAWEARGFRGNISRDQINFGFTSKPAPAHVPKFCTEDTELIGHDDISLVIFEGTVEILHCTGTVHVYGGHLTVGASNLTITLHANNQVNVVSGKSVSWCRPIALPEEVRIVKATDDSHALPSWWNLSKRAILEHGPVLIDDIGEDVLPRIFVGLGFPSTSTCEIDTLKDILHRGLRDYRWYRDTFVCRRPPYTTTEFPYLDEIKNILYPNVELRAWEYACAKFGVKFGLVPNFQKMIFEIDSTAIPIDADTVVDFIDEGTISCAMSAIQYFCSKTKTQQQRTYICYCGQHECWCKDCFADCRASDVAKYNGVSIASLRPCMRLL